MRNLLLWAEQVVSSDLLVTNLATGLFHVDYVHGGIYYSPADGTHTIFGDICRKWIAAGGVGSNIGLSSQTRPR
jgi:hypothetical protein